jgi:hypothetical protein
MGNMQVLLRMVLSQKMPISWMFVKSYPNFGCVSYTAYKYPLTMGYLEVFKISLYPIAGVIHI